MAVYTFGLLNEVTTTAKSEESSTENSTGNSTGNSTEKTTATASATKTEGENTFSEYTFGKSKPIFASYENVLASLHNVAFNRKIYSPNELIVDLVLTVNIQEGDDAEKKTKSELAKITNKVLTDRFLDKDVYLLVTKGSKEQKFENLYIHQLIPLREQNTSIYVRLKAYSFDFQLTQKEYCRSYVAKRVYADILNKKLADEKTLWINQHLSQKHPIAIANNAVMQHMLYGDKKDKEYILPYMVQYNESFYDFMCRTANRCGEFFFFDEGHLFYGVDTSAGKAALDTSNLTKTDDYYDTSISYSECSQSYGKKLNHVDNDYFALSNEVNGESDLLLGEDDFETNWKRDYDSKNSKNLVKSEWSKKPKNSNEATPSDDDFAEMAKNEDKMKKSSGAEDLKYNFEINEDEHHVKVFKKRFSETKVKNCYNEKFWSTSIASLLKAGSLYDLIKTAVIAVTKAPLDFVRTNTKLQSRWEQQVWDKFTNNKDYLPINQELQQKDNAVTPFVAIDGVVKKSDYQNIRKGELYASEQAMVFNLGTTYKRMRLGQKIKDGSNNDYVVVQIKMKPEGNPAKFTAVDNEYPEDFNNMSNSEMQVVAVPLLENKIYPPMHAKGHVRHVDPQVAFVPSHGYMDPRSQGRLRICYPWDESKNASPWLRVMVTSATSGSGTYAEAGPGDEVLVCYFDGNVERPYVGGFLRNKDRTLQYKRGDMYIISKNGHGIGFNDPADPSLFFEGLSPTFKVMKSIAHLIPNRAGIFDGGIDAEDSDSTANQRLIKMSGGTTIKDAYGIYSINMSTDQRTIDINSPFGKVGINAFTGITLSAPNGDITIKGKNVTIEAGNSVKIESGKNVKEGRVMGKTPTDAKAILTQIALDAASGLIPLNEAIKPIDMDVLRCFLEIFLKPVRGTMQIKSNNYLLLEAGNGNAAIESDRYKAGSNLRKDKEKDADAEARKKQLGLRGAIEKTNTQVNTVFDSLKTLRTTATTNFDSLKEVYNTLKENELDDNHTTPENIAKKIWDDRRGLADDPFQKYGYDKENSKAYKDLKFKGGLTEAKTTYLTRIKSFMLAYTNLLKELDRVTQKQYFIGQAGLQKVADDQMIDDNAYKTLYCNTLMALLVSTFSQLKVDEFLKGHKWSDLTVTDVTLDTLKVLFKHQVMANLLNVDEIKQDLGIEAAISYSIDTDNWFDFVQSIKPKSKKDGPGDLLEKATYKVWKDFAKEITEREVWDSTKNGQIIFSEYGDTSYYFDQAGTMHSYSTGLSNTDPESEGKSYRALLLKL